MADVLYVLVMLATIAVMAGLVVACQRVIRPAELENDRRAGGHDESQDS